MYWQPTAEKRDDYGCKSRAAPSHVGPQSVKGHHYDDQNQTKPNLQCCNQSSRHPEISTIATHDLQFKKRGIMSRLDQYSEYSKAQAFLTTTAIDVHYVRDDQFNVFSEARLINKLKN